MPDPKSTPPQSAFSIRLLLATLALLVVALCVSSGLVFFLSHPAALADAPATELPAATPTSESIAVAGPIENGIDVESGFVAAGEYLLVKQTCTSCHSAQLVLQNRATREGWEEMIRWMQATQNLPDLGENEDKVLDYLAKHYAPEYKGRRANLVVEEWYELEP